jgi:PAS domain S-box-containing protein
MPIALPRLLRHLLINAPLRWVLIVPFVVPTIGAVVLVGYLSYRNGYNAVENLGHQLVTETNDRVTQELKTYLQTPLLINRLNVDAVHQGQLDLQNMPALETALFYRAQQFDQVSAVVFASPQGQFRIVERLPDLYLGSADPPHPDAIRMYRLSSEGKRSQIVHREPGLDVRQDRSWYQRAVTTGKPGWNRIFRYESLKALTLNASQPIYDRTTKRLLGVFAVYIRLDYLSEFLHGLDISRSGRVMILDQDDALIATSTQEQPYTVVAGSGYPGQFKQLKLDESQDGLMRSLGHYLRNRPDTLKSLDQAQLLDFHYNGEEQFVKITPVADQLGLTWQIVTVIPKSHFIGTIQDNTRQTLLLSLLTLGTAIALGLLAANVVTARLMQLSRASRKLASGDLDQRLPTDSPIDELNSLAQTFNQMADQLQQSFNRIQIALNESEEKFATIFRTGPEPMAIASLAEGRILEVNDSLLEFFGYSHDEMIGRTALDLNLWHSLKTCEQYRTLLRQQGSIRNLEAQLRTKSGEVRTVLLSAEVRTLEGRECLIVVHHDISDRKTAELALQQSEARYRAIVEDQTELMARSLPDTTLVFVNDAYCRYFGVQRDDVLGKRFCSLIYPDDQDKVAQLMNSMSGMNPTVIMEHRVVARGAIRWTQWVDRLLFDPQGNVTEIQSVGRDITEFKQIEEALRQSEANLLHAQRIAHVGSWEFDLVTQKITWSEELFRIFGLDPTQSEPSYAELLEIIPTEDRDRLVSAVKRAIADGTPYEVDHRICRPNRTIRHVISKGQAVLNDRQTVFKLYGTALDITDRKTAEIALQQYERIFSATTDAISLIDRQYRYQIVNQAYLDWNQKSHTEIIGHSISELVGQDIFETIIQPKLDRCFAGETIQYSEWFDFPALGRQFVSVTYSPYLELDQTVSGALVSARNITPLKYAEAALRESEERFQEIAQTLNQVSYVVSLTTGQYLYISPSYERLWGYSCESLYQNPNSWLERIHPDDLEYVSWGFDQLLSGNQVRLEYRIIGANGDMHWIKSESLVVYDEDGTPIRIVGLADDITDRKQLEQSLRSQAEEERLLATITQHIRQSLDLEQILATTVVEVQRTLNADRVLIFRLNSDGSGQVIQEAVVPEYPMTDQMRWEDEHFTEDCSAYYRQGTPRIVPDVAVDQWAACLAEFMRQAGVKSKVVAPIVQTSGENSMKVWGLLVVHACSYYRQWQDSEADFLQQLCNQLAIAIDQANLYQQLQLELAERKQAEAALRQSEARLAMAQRVVQLGYWEFDVQSQTRTWSDVTFHHWGLDPTQPEPSFSELLQMVHPDDRTLLQASIEAAITPGVPYALDMRVVHPDGSVHYLDSRAEPLFNAQGQVVKLIGTSLDITDRKQIENVLQEREAMLRAIGDNLPKGFIYQRIYEPGKGFYYSYLSAGVERLLGIKPEAILANPDMIRTIGFEADLAEADQIVQESLKNLTPVELQMRNQTAQGDVQWSSLRSIPRRLSDGRTVWDGVEVDITDLKRTEAALRANEELFRSAFDGAPIGISLVSITGQFVKVNPRYCDLLGYTEAELLKLTFREITHPADLKSDLEGFRQMMAGEICSFQLEKRYISKQGTAIPVLMNAALIRDQNGQPLYCVGQVQDIRDRLRVERLKDEFISVVSHELRTPLTSIRGALGILGSGIFEKRPEKAQQMLQIAINNSDRLVRLVDDILSLERLGSDKVQLVMEQCWIADLMQQAIDSVQAIADQAGITLSFTLLSTTLWAAPDAIVQTLTNLLGNAIKFSSPGDTVWLKAEIKAMVEIAKMREAGELRKQGELSSSSALSPSSCGILFIVKDQGRGIPDNKLEIIFEQFLQVDVSDSRKKGGTGLGLAICKKIVQHHGGHIWVESSLGKGSTFYVALPLVTPNE